MNTKSLEEKKLEIYANVDWLKISSHFTAPYFKDFS
jgi:hypothetical protein